MGLAWLLPRPGLASHSLSRAGLHGPVETRHEAPLLLCNLDLVKKTSAVFLEASQAWRRHTLAVTCSASALPAQKSPIQITPVALEVRDQPWFLFSPPHSVHYFCLGNSLFSSLQHCSLVQASVTLLDTFLTGLPSSLPDSKDSPSSCLSQTDEAPKPGQEFQH